MMIVIFEVPKGIYDRAAEIARSARGAAALVNLNSAVKAHPTSTRRPLILGGIGLSLHAAMQSEPLTAAAVIDKIKANIGVPWREKTVDNLIAGAPTTPIKGIATTMMATLDVLQRAHAAGRNMVITHESTFFSHQDTIDQLREDKTYLYKLNFIEKNNMAVFHFHDHWHARRPA